MRSKHSKLPHLLLLWSSILLSACAGLQEHKHPGRSTAEQTPQSELAKVAALAGVPLQTLEKVRDTPQGQRPAPETYLPATYIQQHLAQFDKVASYLVPTAALDRFGRDLLGRADGQFVLPAPQLDSLLAEAKGDIAVVEVKLGIPAGSWDGKPVSRIDVPNPRALHLRLPSGNEAGANPLWLPGGHLPTGLSEAVVDPIPKGSYTESAVKQAP